MTPCRTTPDQDSIFGNTYCGVPNPQVPHLHPYPTRFHGRVGTQPQAFLPYVDRPWSRGPIMGRAKPMQPWELRGVDSIDTSPQSPLWIVAAAVFGGGLGAIVAVPPEGKADPLTVGAAAAMGAAAVGVLTIAAQTQHKLGG